MPLHRRVEIPNLNSVTVEPTEVSQEPKDETRNTLVLMKIKIQHDTALLTVILNHALNLFQGWLFQNPFLLAKSCQLFSVVDYSRTIP